MTDEEAQTALMAERDELTKQQDKAILTAALFRMSKEEAAAYDKREARIAEITKQLAGFGGKGY